MEPHPLPHTILSLDVVDSTPGGNVRHLRLLRGLRESVGSALAGAPHGAQWIRRPDGDGETLLAPAQVSKAQVLGGFLPQLESELRSHNWGRETRSRVRVRVAVDQGDVTVVDGLPYGGNALVRVARLRDIEPLRELLDRVPEAVVGLVLPDDFYRTFVLEGEPGLLPEAYRRVTARAKNFQQTAWVRLLSYHLPDPDAGTGRGGAAPADGDPPDDGPAGGVRPARPRPPDQTPPAGGDHYAAHVGTNDGAMAFGPGSRARVDRRHG